MQTDLESLAPGSGVLSCDRVTFLMFTPSLSVWSDNRADRETNSRRIADLAGYIQGLAGSRLDPDFPQGLPSQLFAHHFRTSDGVDIQFGARMPKRLKVSDLDYIQSFGTDEEKESGYCMRYVPNDYGLRIEFNPNKCTLDSVRFLLGHCAEHQLSPRFIRIARFDLAVDYYRFFNPEFITCRFARKSFLAYGTAGIESLYFGSRQSQTMFRVYNKRQEQIDQGEGDPGRDWWRIELESKKAFTLDTTPDYVPIFQRLSLSSSCFDDFSDWKLRFIKFYALNFSLSAALRLMPRDTSNRYKAIFDTFSSGVEHPSYTVKRDFPQVFNRVRMQILDACGYKLADENGNF